MIYYIWLSSEVTKQVNANYTLTNNVSRLNQFKLIVNFSSSSYLQSFFPFQTCGLVSMRTFFFNTNDITKTHLFLIDSDFDFGSLLIRVNYGLKIAKNSKMKYKTLTTFLFVKLIGFKFHSADSLHLGIVFDCILGCHF